MTVEKVKPQERQKHTDGMEKMAYEVVEAHLAPAPMAEDYAPQFFPPAVLRGLGIGILVGGVLGLIAGYLLLTNMITVPGWEGMYSLGETAFLSLWMVIGIAAGIVFIGISTILMAPDAVDVEVVDHRE